MPYEDERTPGAPLWFASSNGRTGEEFVTLLSAENVEALKRANGVSVVYTHFAADFTRPGPDRRRVRGDVRETLTRCATDPTVAFVPAGDMLDRMRLAQLVKRGLAAGERTIRVPAVLEGQEMHVSVRAEEGRRSLPAWLDAKGCRLEWSEDTTVFEDPVRVGWRERWRMVGRWVLTQFQTPT